jgi:2-methylcitrate dehydratase PrpD
MVTAMFDLIEGNEIAPQQVKRLRVSLGKTANDMHGIFPRYKGKFEALLSTHYVVAAILEDRALTLAQFEPVRYDDPTLRTFAAEQVVMKSDATLTGMQAAVEADTTDGRTLAVRSEHSKGSPENPLTRAQIEEKFRAYAKGRLPAAHIDEVIGIVARLEDLESTRRLMDLLRAS